MHPQLASPENRQEKKLPLWLEVILLLIGAFSVAAGLYAIVGAYQSAREVHYDLIAAVAAALWLIWKTCLRIKKARA